MQKKIISHKQYRSGMKLRWLYTLRHGSPSIQSKPLKELFFTPKNYNIKWLAEKQKMYIEIMLELKKVKMASLVADICIFQVAPRWIYRSFCYQKDRFCRGMEILEKLMK